MVASLVSSSRSRRRSSETSRTSSTAPTRWLYSVTGTARRERLTPRASTSVRQAARPITTSGSDSSTGELASTSGVTTSASGRPTISSVTPSRWNAESAFGLA